MVFHAFIIFLWEKSNFFVFVYLCTGMCREEMLTLARGGEGIVKIIYRLATIYLVRENEGVGVKKGTRENSHVLHEYVERVIRH